jgi:hypothetical protein
LNRKELKRNSLKPYTQKQNGVAESKDGTTVESVRCMLHGHSICLKFWRTKAVQIAVYV